MPFTSSSWENERKSYNFVLEKWQLYQKRTWLLIALAQENGIDLEWVLHADKETLNQELLKRDTPDAQI